MFCTYSSKGKRHGLKEAIHNLIRNTNLANILKEYENKTLKLYNNSTGLSPVFKYENGKPFLFIIVEKFTKGHAMFRCYSKLVKGLREEFRTVCIVYNEANFDNIAEKSFDYFYLVTGLGIDDRSKVLVSLLEKHKPCAIYY